MHLNVPFQDELFAVSISICVGLRCGRRAPSIIPLSAACRALCHFILSFLLIVQYILLQTMLLDRCRGFSMLTSLQNYLASIPPAHSTGPAVYVYFMLDQTGIAQIFLTGHPAVGGLSPGSGGPMTICWLELKLARSWSWASYHSK